MTHGANNTNSFPKQDGFTLEDKLECDPKDQSRVKTKKIDIFWEYKDAKNKQTIVQCQQWFKFIATPAVKTTVLYRNAKELKFYKCC